MKAVFRFVAIAALFFAASAVFADDWTTYRGDNARTGATSEKFTLPLKNIWTASAPSAPKLSWSGPENRIMEGHKLQHRVNYDDAFQVAIVGDKLYFGSSVDHQLYCYQLGTGKRLWNFFTGGAIRLAPTVWNDQVFFSSDDGYAYSVRADTGELIWKIRGGPNDEWILGRGEMVSRWAVRTGVTVDDGVAYFAAGIFPHEDIYLYAVNAKTGKIIWKRDNISESEAGRNALSPQGYLLTSKKILVVPSGRSLPAAFDRKSGSLIHHRTHSWRSTAGGDVGGTRALMADGQIYSNGEHHILAMDEAKGNVGFAWIDARQLVVTGDLAYTANGTMVRRLDRIKHAEASRTAHALDMKAYNLRRSLRGNPKNADEIRKQITEMEKEIAEANKVGVIWEAPSESIGSLLATGNLVIAGGAGRMDAFDAETGKLEWTAKVEGDVSGLAAANGHIVASTTTGKVYIFADAEQPKANIVRPTPANKDPYAKDALTPVFKQAAADIVEQTNIKNGFCLVAGAETGRLAFELAKASQLKIYAVEPDAKKVALARQQLNVAGLYGTRIVVHQADYNDIFYSDYFANLITSDVFVKTGNYPGDLQKAFRHLKPLGGKVCLGQPGNHPQPTPKPADLRRQLSAMLIGEIGRIATAKSYGIITRGKLEGADDWSHQYGDPGNTASNQDQRVKGGLGVLWFGDPGPGKMVNRHEGAMGPVSVNGRLFVQGQFSVMAYDAYNGMFLWEHKNPGTFRTGVFQNFNPSNLVASKDRVFVLDGPIVVELDAATGKLLRKHELPDEKRKDREWTYLAHQDGLIFGTSSVRKELLAKYKRRGRKYEDATDAMFAIDVKTGKPAWTFVGKNISHRTIALGPKHVFFVDSELSEEQRDDLLKQDKSELEKLEGEALKLAQDRIKRLDARLAVCVEIASGKKIWETPVDVTDITDLGAGGGKLTLMHKDGVLVLSGANANGHYWGQFMSGEFKRRRLVVLSATDGKKLWAKDANYRHRPIIVGSKLIAEPWAFDLYTGKQYMRPNPITGKEEPWSIIRPGHHCGMLTGAPNMLFFRSGYTGFYDLYADSGTRHFAGHRLGCWINAIPANGLVMIPEASAGCVCQFSIASTITMAPRKARRPWTIYSSIGKQTPVKRMALNLGAPGDRKDAFGTVWLAYPRPDPVRATGLDVKMNLKQQFIKGGGFKSINARATKVDGTETPWLFTSWADGLTSITIPVLGKDDDPATYTVRLYFANMSKTTTAFDVKMQGKTVLKNLDVSKVGNGRAFVREIENVNASGDLVIELMPRNASELPILNAIEIVRSDSQ